MINIDTLPEQVQRWIVDVVGCNATIQSVRPLHGGISSLIHRVLLNVDQKERNLVVRQFNNAEWLQEEPDLALHEAESLRFASLAGLRAPNIIAFDKDGSVCGMPTVLMTYLKGEVVLRPHHMEQWVDGLAEALAEIHAVKAGDFPWSYFTYCDISTVEVPAWSRLPALWEKVIAIVSGPRPQVKNCFIHRDYHPANVLWTGSKVSGIVDWVNACRGPAGIDVGHCRMNLAMLCGVAAADAFLSAYQRHAGAAFSHDPYWDMVALVDFGSPSVYAGWTALGVTGLTDQLMMERVDHYMQSLLTKI